MCGVALGRWLWTRFAEKVDVVPAPAVTLGAVGVVVVATFLLANALALLPGNRGEIAALARAARRVALRARGLRRALRIGHRR